jgi:hypothetical protein
MKPIILALSLAASLFADGDYKAQPGGALPESAATLKATLEASGTKVVDGAGKLYAELWLRTTQPADAKSAEQNITLPEMPHGALMGVISFPAGASDRRGQAIKPGVYTMRYSQFPITGDHQGVAPQRDFLILSPIGEDKDPEAMPKFDALMVMSRKASGTTHPLILSMWKSDQPGPSLAKEGEHDWVLTRKIGSLPVAIIVSGRAEG